MATEYSSKLEALNLKAMEKSRKRFEELKERLPEDLKEELGKLIVAITCSTYLAIALEGVYEMEDELGEFLDAD